VIWYQILFAAFGIAALSTVLVVSLMGTFTQWLQLRRRFGALQSRAPHATIIDEYHPLSKSIAKRVIQFTATGPCPHCGFYDTHLMVPPSDKDILCAVVRKCHSCLHVWGES
jgi:hypothetical protein